MTIFRDSKFRRGFTLVELLVVMLIIGVLAAVAIPAVWKSVISTQEAAIKLEIDGLSAAMEKYRNKYGEYPPDGTSWTEFERHLRTVFPNIVSSEVNIFRPGMAVATVVNGSNGTVMEPAEALVLFLGGLSSDPQHPFTGPGGPFTSTMAYSTDRSNPYFDFDSSRLTVNAASTSSTDEELYNYNGSPANDLLPVYLSKYSNTPIAYFNSRSYVMTPATDPRNSIVSRYASDTFGVAVPYVSDNPNNNYAGDFHFMQKSGFQIIATGLDGKFNDGTVGDTPQKSDVQRFPSQIPDQSSNTTYDNIASFADQAKIGVAARTLREAN